MCRFLFLLLIVLAVFFGIAAIFGVDALFWPLIIGLVGSSFGLLLLPKRGDQHAFGNLYRKLAFYLLILIAVSVIGGIYALAILLPHDASDVLVNAGITGILALIFLVTFLVIRPIYPFAQSRMWFRMKFPRVRDSIYKYKQKGDALDDNNPILNINCNRYFLVPYMNRKIPDKVNGYLLLDETGTPADEKNLVRIAAKCRSLALQTFDYGLSQARARSIQNHWEALAGLEKMNSLLKEKLDTLDRLDSEIIEDVEQILATEEDILLIGQTSIDISMLEARWTKEHGLGKLTEINYEDVEKFEEEIRQIRRPMIEGIPKVLRAAESAERLAEAIKRGQISVVDSYTVREALLGIVEGSGTLNPQNEDVYGTMTEELWQAWRDRMEWVKKVDAGLVEPGS